MIAGRMAGHGDEIAIARRVAVRWRRSQECFAHADVVAEMRSGIGSRKVGALDSSLKGMPERREPSTRFP